MADSHLPPGRSAQVAPDGKTATLVVKPLAANGKAVSVPLPGGGTKPLSAQSGGTATFPVKR